MEKRQWLDRLRDHGSISTRISAACELVRYLEDSEVVDNLCRIAAMTQSRKLRKAIVMTLRYNPGKVGPKLADLAVNHPAAACRRQAFFLLSELDCRDAREAVMEGLEDPIGSVRRAAAFNAGLYNDPEMAAALIRFFVHHESAFIREAAYRAWEWLQPYRTLNDRGFEIRRTRTVARPSRGPHLSDGRPAGAMSEWSTARR